MLLINARTKLAPRTRGVINIKLNFHHEPIRKSDTSFICPCKKSSLRKIQATIMTETRPANAMPNWLMKLSTASNTLMPPRVAYNNEMIADKPPPTITDFVRDTLNLSCTPAIYVSVIEINDVIPANTRHPKTRRRTSH